MAIKRFTPIQKGFHFLLLVSFLIQAATGTARMYIESEFGRSMAALFGGYDGCLVIHKAVGLFMILLFIIHLLYVLIGVLPGTGLGPDTLIPKPRDIGDFFRHLGWMLGAREAPDFERWGYWEKFDYWAVFWGMVVIGGTGLILYDPLATSRVMDGRALNVAFWIHRIEAVLAMLHVFIIHFLIAHLRKSHFPMDMAMFAGDSSEASISDERKAWLTRLLSQGKADEVTSAGSGVLGKIISYIIGFAALATGIYILIGGIINAGYITW